MSNFFWLLLQHYLQLQIPSISENISNVTDITDPVLAAINMFQDHPSMKSIRINFTLVFSSIHTNEIEIKKIIRGMNVHKICKLIKRYSYQNYQNEFRYFSLPILSVSTLTIV